MTEAVEVPAFKPDDECRKLHSELRAELLKRELSGSENFDKSVLTLSSAGLGLSISFLKDFVPPETPGVPWMLYLSWGMFTAATLSTMASFLVSGKAIKRQLVLADRGYLQGDWKAFEEKNPWDRLTTRLNVASMLTFLGALVLTTIFIISSLESNRMATGNFKPTGPVLEKRGASVPPMQRPVSAPATAPAAPASAPSGGTSTGNPSGPNK